MRPIIFCFRTRECMIKNKRKLCALPCLFVQGSCGATQGRCAGRLLMIGDNCGRLLMWGSPWCQLIFELLSLELLCSEAVIGISDQLSNFRFFHGMMCDWSVLGVCVSKAGSMFLGRLSFHPIFYHQAQYQSLLYSGIREHLVSSHC